MNNAEPFGKAKVSLTAAFDTGEVMRSLLEHLEIPEHQLKLLGDGTYVAARRLMFHWIIIRGDVDDAVGYFDRWCYATEELALKALKYFPESPPQGYEPSGWHRHPSTHRRRPGGDPALEYIDP